MNKDIQPHNLIIIGSGPAGLTASIYAARAHLNPLVLAGITPGGQLMGTTLVENFPGFAEGIMGPELMQNMITQAQKYGAELINENVTEVDFSGNVKKVFTHKEVHQARSVIIAVGSSPRKLSIEGEEKLWGRGVSTCATCDGAFYKDKVVAVVGGGDSAMEESSFLTRFAKKVYIIHRRKEFKASKEMQNRVLNNEKIEVLWDTEVQKIEGDKVVESLQLKNINDNKISTLEVDGIFLAVGHTPNTKWLEGEVDLDEKGYIKTTGQTKTSVEGVFAAGDVYDHQYKQAITASAMGCMAAIDAQNWLEHNDY